MTRPGSPTRNELLFNYVKVTYGDKLVRGVKVVCGYCEESQDVPVNTFSTRQDDTDNHEAAFITRKLENMGWKVGRSMSQHRCPKCYSAIKLAAVRKREGNTAMADNKVVPIIEAATRAMTRDDRRIIFEKLNEVYVSDKVGYGPGWTDHKVATDLGVPRAWVKLIRDENFGDEFSNEEIRKLIDECRQVLKDTHAAAAHVEAALEEYRRLTGVSDKLLKSVNEVAKTFT